MDDSSARRLSDTALQCTLPKGQGINLPVRVSACDCATAAAAAEYALEATSTSAAARDAAAAAARTTFSYNEGAALHQSKVTRASATDRPASSW